MKKVNALSVNSAFRCYQRINEQFRRHEVVFRTIEPVDNEDFDFSIGIRAPGFSDKDLLAKVERIVNQWIACESNNPIGEFRILLKSRDVYILMWEK